MVPPPTLSEQDAFFREGVQLCFARWTALQLAVENGWGGRQSADKARQLERDVVSWFYRSKGQPYADELEELLDEAMLQGFNTEAEDGSLTEVADKLVVIYRACAAGDFEPIKELRALAARRPASLAGSQRAPATETDADDDESDEASGEEAMDAPPPAHGHPVPPHSSSMEQDGGHSGGVVGGAGPLGAAREPGARAQLSSEEIEEGWELPAARGRRGHAPRG